MTNILHSIGVAILLLDPALKIRLFTPETAKFFRLISSDIGRPLGDLNYLAPDPLLADDCDAALRDQRSVSREIEMPGSTFFLRRISPYYAENGDLDGLALTFNEISETRSGLLQQAFGLEKPQIFAAASGLRMKLPLSAPPETASAPGETAQQLIRLIGQTASTLSFMLNNLRGSASIGLAEMNAVPQPITTAEQQADAARRVGLLTPRERQVMKLVVAGLPSKTIAAELGISERTVENHRAAIMRKTESKSLPALARVAFASGLSSIGEPEGGI